MIDNTKCQHQNKQYATCGCTTCWSCPDCGGHGCDNLVGTDKLGVLVQRPFQRMTDGIYVDGLFMFKWKLDDPKYTPTTKTGDAGYDLYCMADEDFSGTGYGPEPTYALAPGERKRFKTGVRISLPGPINVMTSHGFVVRMETYANIRDRSGNANKKGLHVLAGVGDRIYRGELQVVLLNTSDEFQYIRDGDRIAQFIIEVIIKPAFQTVDTLDETDRGENGFGSSGD